jgi:hypothetical protein
VRDQLTAAIEQRKIVTFTYGGHERRVQPTAFGQSHRRRKDTLQGYQVGGGSSRGGIPHWRAFFVEQMTGLQVLDEVYGPNPPGFSRSGWMEVSIEPTTVTAPSSGGTSGGSSGGSSGRSSGDGEKKDQVIPGVPITGEQAAKAVDAAGKALGKLSKWFKSR